MPPDPSPDLWDVLSRRPASTTTSTSPDPRRRPLALSPDPRPHWLPRKPRSFGSVPTDLLSPLRECCEGTAPWPLLLRGPVGSGKTCAALALLDHLAGSGRGWYFAAAGLAELAADLVCGRTHATGPRSVAGLWEALSYSRLVVLDEVGVGARDRGEPPYLSHHHCDTVKRLLDARETLPLVCCSNFRLGELTDLYGDAVASRLAGGTVVALDGPDRRIGAKVG